VTYQKTARLSFNAGADAFVTRRRSSALYGFTGYRVRGDLAYRTSRYATTGVAYDFTHFEYTKGFGGSDIHTVQFVQSFRLGRYWELSARAGGSRVETLGLTRVAIDPVIAAIVGRSSAVEVIYRINWVPSADVTLTRAFRHASMSFDYQRGVTPGNGLFLTSRQEAATGSYTYTGIRKLNIGLQAGYSSIGSLTQTIGNYAGLTGGGGLTYNLTKALHFVTRYDYRHYDVDQTTFKRNTYRVTMGFAFSPGDVPLALW
jgi:opacity protein-like surface antigen